MRVGIVKPFTLVNMELAEGGLLTLCLTVGLIPTLRARLSPGVRQTEKQ